MHVMGDDRLRAVLRDLQADDLRLLECQIVDGWQYSDIAGPPRGATRCFGATARTDCERTCDAGEGARSPERAGVDGAEWIWNIADQHFPGAIQIVDLYHARQYLWDLARKLHPNQQAEQERWMVIHKDALLDEGRIEDLVASLRSIESSNPELAEKIRIEADYFEKNTERMRYPQFRAQHLFVGSGVIEAGCKTIIGSRCKQSGMFWIVRGANAIMALRCCYFNGRFEDYWEARRPAA
jgi:hypothetical protein